MPTGHTTYRNGEYMNHAHNPGSCATPCVAQQMSNSMIPSSTDINNLHRVDTAVSQNLQGQGIETQRGAPTFVEALNPRVRPPC